jgi:crotonobetainyl-CoA:carnitine CoA-transferase CaiB-like acyl-CoA transferase
VPLPDPEPGLAEYEVSPAPRAGPLAGIRVLDLSNLMAGPMLAMHLGDMGAEVVKVEAPVGDEMRRWGHSKSGHGLFFKVVNRNKRLVCIDLRTPAGQQLIRDLAAQVDIVVESFRPGTMERWNLGYDELSEMNSDLILVRVSGFGQYGPYSSRPGFGTIAEAFSGFAHLNGSTEGPPLLPSFGLGDASAAIFGAFGATCALMAAKAGKGGQVVDVSLYEGLMALLGSVAVDFDALGLVQQRSGGRLPFVAPRNTYLTEDGQWIAVAGSTQRSFEKLRDALNLDVERCEVLFGTNMDRVRNAEVLDEILAEQFARLTCEQALDVLVTAGVPAARVNSIADLVEDPHIIARQSLVSIPDEDLGSLLVQNVAPKLSRTPGNIFRAGGSRVGEETREVIQEYLHLTDKQLQHLADLGAISGVFDA